LLEKDVSIGWLDWERENTRWAASDLGWPEVAVEMWERMRALMEVLLGVVV
jgi:hypothetical protein